MLTANYLIWFVFPSLALIAKNKTNKLIFSSIVCIIATIIAVYQDPNTNKDRDQYINIIDSVVNGELTLIEPSYLLLIKILANFFTGYALETIFFSIIALGAISIKIMMFNRYGANLTGCLLAYLSYFFLLHEMTQIRIGLAIGVLYLSWFSWIEGRRTSYYFLGLISSLLHYSCLIFIIAPLVLSLKKDFRFKALITILLFFGIINIITRNFLITIISYFGETIGIEKLISYAELFQDGIFSEISFTRLIPHAALAFIYIVNYKMWHADKFTKMLLRIHLIGILLFMIFSTMPIIAYRLSDLFLFAGVFLVGRLRTFLPSSLYYPFAISYTAVFLYYTTQSSGLFTPN